MGGLDTWDARALIAVPRGRCKGGAWAGEYFPCSRGIPKKPQQCLHYREELGRGRDGLRVVAQQVSILFPVITVFIISNSVEERVDVCSTTPPSRRLEIENFIFFRLFKKYTNFQ